jgi:hypothetical protein
MDQKQTLVGNFQVEPDFQNVRPGHTGEKVLIVQPNEYDQEDFGNLLTDKKNAWGPLLIIVSLFTAVQYFAIMVTCLVYAYKHENIDSVHYMVVFGVMGCYAGLIAYKNSARTYAMATFVHAFYASISFSVGYILVYCEITNTKCALFEIVADLFDFYAYYERSYYTYYNRGAGCTSYLLLGMIIMLSNGITNIFIAWFYHSFGADSLSALKEEATTNGNEPTQYAIKPVQQPTYGKENQEAAVDVEEATDCIMIGCSIIVAVLEVLLFILLVRDCGNRFRYLQFPQLGYHLLLGVLAGYSIYIACMHAVPVYHSAALVRTGQSMVMFVMCFISLFHSAVKFTAGFGHGGNPEEGVEYFIYGILAAIFACLYAVVAYI